MILNQMYSGSSNAMFAVVAVVVVLLLIGVMVPLLIKKARKDSKKARSFIPDLIRMSGLKQSGKADFTGTYKGFPTTLTIGMGVNYAESGFEVMKGIAGGGMDFHQRNLFYQKFTIIMKLPGQNNKQNSTEFALKEKVGVLRTDQWIMDTIEGKKLELPELKDLKFGKVRVFGKSKGLAEKISKDNALRNLLSNWHFTDVRVYDNQVVFTLDDNMVQPTFESRLQTPDYIIQALDITARVAELVSKN